MSYNNEIIGLLATVDAPFSSHMIKEILNSGIEVDFIIFDGKKMSEKDGRIWNERTQGKIPYISLAEFQDRAVPFYYFKSHNSPEVARFVRDKKTSLLINAGTPRILGQKVLSSPERGVLNIHPGELPYYRGCTVLEWAIYNDDRAGNTVHFMSVGIDEGPIVSSEIYEFSKSDTYAYVRIKNYLNAFQLMSRSIKKVVDNNMTSKSLPPQGEGNYYKVMPPELLEEVKKKLKLGQYKYQY